MAVLVSLLFIVSCVPSQGGEDLPLEPKAPGSTGPLAGRAYSEGLRLAGYADPRGYFSITPDPTVNLWTPEHTSLLSSRVENSQLVYRYGYKTDKNGRWQRFEFGGTRVGTSNWLRRSATKEFTISTAEYDLGEANYLIAYACSRDPVTSRFKCHDNKWMAHQFFVGLTDCNFADDNCPVNYGCEVDPADATKSYCLQLPEVPLTPNYIKVFAIQGMEDTAGFDINNEAFNLKVSATKTLSNEISTVKLNGVLIQDFAGGLSGVDFGLTKLCSSDYSIKAHYTLLPENVEQGVFTVSYVSRGLTPVEPEESFTLLEGEEKTLRDGAGIKLLDAFSQDYAGGSRGVIFELYCVSST